MRMLSRSPATCFGNSLLHLVSVVLWENQTACNLTIHLQNTGKLVLKNGEIGVIVNGSDTSISNRRMLTSTTDWIQGNVLELRICPTGLTLNSGDETVLTIIVRSEEYRGVSGTYAFSGVIRIG